MNFKILLQRHYEKLIFILLALAILYPVLGRGYVLTLDMIFTPNMSFDFPPEGGVYARVVINFLLEFLAKLIPADILQKLILFGTLYLIPSAFLKLSRIFEKHENDYKAVRILGALLYLWNPFVYSRLLAGHWLFLIGYGLLPIFIFSLYEFFRTKFRTKEFYIKLGTVNFLLFAISTISIHHFFFFVLIIVLYAAIEFIRKKKDLSKKIGFVLLTGAILNSTWIIPTVLHFALDKGFGENDLIYFASSPDTKLGLLTNLITFYGFWAEKTLFELPKESLIFWPLSFLVLLAPVAIFFISYLPKELFKKLKVGLKKPKTDIYLVLFFVLIGAIGLLLANGSHGIAKPLYDIFYFKFPLLTAFRESQKFLSLYILSFSIFFYLGLRIWSERIMKHTKLVSTKELRKVDPKLTKDIFLISLKRITLGAFALLILANTYTLLSTKYKPRTTNYPNSWEILEEITSGEDGKILVLPYQSYAVFGFNKSRISNPAPLYFTTDVISKVTLDELYKSECDVEWEFCLNKEDQSDIWYEELVKYNVSHILVNKNDDWKDYAFLRRDLRFTKIIEDQYALVLRVEK